MTPSELRRNLEQMQNSSLALIMSLTMINRDIANLICAMENSDNEGIREHVYELSKSSAIMADSLDDYCSASAFFLER